MNISKGYYCVVQYLHDIVKAESVNIGVVLFVPERGVLLTKITKDVSRVRLVFRMHDDDEKVFRVFRNEFEKRLSNETLNLTSKEQLEQFVSTRTTQIQLTEPRFVRVEDSKETLNDLFKTMVTERPHTPSRVLFPTQLKAMFLRASVDRFLNFDIPVRVPLYDRLLKVQFGFQNGVYNLLPAVSFEAEEVEHNFGKACKLSMEGKAIQEIGIENHPKVKFRVIARFKNRQSETAAVVKAALSENGIEMIPEFRVPELIDEIRYSAKTPNLPH